MRFSNANRFRAALLAFGVLFSMAGCGSGSGASSSTAERDSAAAEAAAGELVVAFPVGAEGAEQEEGRSYDTITMGRMAEGEVIEGRFGVANRTGKPLVIVQVITGCGCTTADYDPAPIAPGDTLAITWQFDSKGRYGQQFKSIEVIAAAAGKEGGRECATVYLEGEVI